MNTMTYVWLILSVILCLVEVATAQLMSIWFIIGSVGAIFTSLFTDSITAQISVFVVLSLITLIFARPVLKKAILFKKEDTNLGRYIGKKAFVLSEINNDLGKGQINVNGSIWTARSADGSIIKEGETVIVESINGVKCSVKKIIKGGDE